MRAISAGVPLLVAALPLAGCRGCTDNDPTEPSILVLVLDGVRTTEFSSTTESELTGVSGEAWAPRTWSDLAPEAAVVREQVNPGITVTASAHAQLLSGRIDAYANFPIEDRDVGVYRPNFPTIFEEARLQLGLSGNDVVFVANTELLEGNTWGVYPGYEGGARYDLVTDPDGLPATDDTDVFDAIDALVDEGAPRVLIVNVHDIDRAAHFGAEEAYVDNIVKVDRLLDGLRTRIANEHPTYAENLMMVVTSDHGRHDTTGEEDWRSHGDQCTGCREVPLLVVGGGARAGEVVEGSVTQLDLAPTLGAHLGIDVPWAEGLPLSALVDGLEAPARAGDVDLAVSEGLVATRRWRDDADARSEIVVDDEVLSTPGVFAAEGPAVLSGTADYACFRELELTEGAEEWPWRARCLRREADTWEDIGAPVDEVGPLTRFAFVEHGESLWAAWPSNPHAIAELGTNHDVGLGLAVWTPDDGWGEVTMAETYFPTDVAFMETAQGAVVALGTNHGGNGARGSRQVRVAAVTRTDDTLHVGEMTYFELPELFGEQVRVERPALGASGHVLWLAMLGTGVDGTAVAVASSEDGGTTWSAASLLPKFGEILPNVTPVWNRGYVNWTTWSDGEAWLCRMKPTDTEPTCMRLGSPRVDSLHVDDGVLTFSRDDGSADWKIATTSW